MPDKKRKKRKVVTADQVDREALEQAIKSQGNAVPVAVAVALRLVAPILTRIAIRYVARRYRKRISDQAVQTTSAYMGSIVGKILERVSGE